MVSNCNVGAITYLVCWVGTDQGQHQLACQVVFQWKRTIALQAGHALPVKWCLKEKVLLGNSQQLQCWSYNMYGLLCGHWPRGSTGRRLVRKKRPAKRVFFFWFPLRKYYGDASSRSGLTDFSPHINIYLSIYLSISQDICQTKKEVDAFVISQSRKICLIGLELTVRE